MRRFLVVALSLIAACHGSDPATGSGAGSTSPTATTPTTPTKQPGSASEGSGGGSAAATTPAPNGGGSAVATSDPPKDTKPTTPVPEQPIGGHDFTQIAKDLLVVGACADGTPPEGVPAAALEKHCNEVKKAQAAYMSEWVKPASGFFKDKVPATVPKKVVYPFAGGDLSTALTVYPDADEITTMSLEPAGDPRTLAALTVAPAPMIAKTKTPPDKPAAKRANPQFERALAAITKELAFLYRVNFSNTSNMEEAMSGGGLPTQLVFGLSALKIHGYEVVALRYFRLEPDGAIHYLDDAEVAKAPDPLKMTEIQRNKLFANAEIRFRKPGGRTQIYRHIQVNLNNNEATRGLAPIKKDPRIIKHLEMKGQVAGMTKAASYLLSWESFSMIRDYLLGHVVWMVSDATGIAPKWGKGKGFEYETYGGFIGPHLPAGSDVSKDWRDEWESQPKRDLIFRFGYWDKKGPEKGNHLVIMRKKA
jgi:hypothetical protein